MPTIDLTDTEHAALTALIRRAIEEDRFPPRPAPRPAALSAGEARAAADNGGGAHAAPPATKSTGSFVPRSVPARKPIVLMSLAFGGPLVA